MSIRRYAILVLTIFATFSALMATPVGALETWEATTESECMEAGGEWDGLYCNEIWTDTGDTGGDDGSLWSATNET
ncbi:MAG TPA: hypothetical protein EYG34_05835, partial [Acidimicrobiia bacterium]|nr:hypothetical protein [Acidimicrobiia bacterium]